VGADDVGAGGLGTIGTGDQLGQNQPVGGPAFALAAGRMAAFL